MNTPVNPLLAGQPPSPQMQPQSPVSGAQQTLGASSGPLLQMAQSAMQNPMGQAVPPAGGGDLTQHPLVAALIKGIANAAQSFGWTAMQPQERVERQQMQQQKAETLANLAGTQAYREGMLGYRGGELGVSQQNADTRASAEKFNEQYKAAQQDLAQSKSDWQKVRAEAQTAIGQGNLAVAQSRLKEQYAKLSQQASQFEDMLKIRTQQVGINQAKLELGQQANDIRQQAVDVAKMLGTAKTDTGADEWDKSHYILSSLFGGIGDQVAPVLGQQQPGTPIGNLTAPQPSGTAGGGAGAGPAPTVGAPTSPKAAAKKSQKGGGDPFSQFGGVAH